MVILNQTVRLSRPTRSSRHEQNPMAQDTRQPDSPRPFIAERIQKIEPDFKTEI